MVKNIGIIGLLEIWKREESGRGEEQHRQEQGNYLPLLHSSEELLYWQSGLPADLIEVKTHLQKLNILFKSHKVFCHGWKYLNTIWFDSNSNFVAIIR